MRLPTSSSFCSASMALSPRPRFLRQNSLLHTHWNPFGFNPYFSPSRARYILNYLSTPGFAVRQSKSTESSTGSRQIGRKYFPSYLFDLPDRIHYLHLLSKSSRPMLSRQLLRLLETSKLAGQHHLLNCSRNSEQLLLHSLATSIESWFIFVVEN